MVLSKEIGFMVEQLTDKKQLALLEFLKSMLDDDYITLEDRKNIKQSRAEYFSGQAINHNDIDWD